MKKKELDSFNMSVVSIHQPLDYGRAILISDIEYLCKAARIFSCKVIVLHSTTLGSQLLDRDFINKLKDLQRKNEVKFGIENMPKKFLNF